MSQTRFLQRVAPRLPLGVGAALKAAAAALALAVGCACRGAASEEAKSEPIPECAAYERALARCFPDHQADAEAALEIRPNSDREQLRQLCVTNMKRIQDACR
jgi:hypothetical protein